MCSKMFFVILLIAICFISTSRSVPVPISDITEPETEPFGTLEGIDETSSTPLNLNIWEPPLIDILKETVDTSYFDN